MNYSEHYFRLCDRAINRRLPPGTYFERHHIEPVCMGGDNKRNNLVKLLPEEHYLAHMFLARMFPTHPKLLAAAKSMSSGRYTSNKTYGADRRISAIYCSVHQSRRTPEEKKQREREKNAKKAAKIRALKVANGWRPRRVTKHFPRNHPIHEDRTV